MTLSLSCCWVDSAYHPPHCVRSRQLECKQMLRLQTSRGTNGEDRRCNTHSPRTFHHLSVSNRYSICPNSPRGRCSYLSSRFPRAHSARIYEHMKVKWKIKDRASQHDQDIEKHDATLFFYISSDWGFILLFSSKMQWFLFFFYFLWLLMFRHRRSKNRNWY